MVTLLDLLNACPHIHCSVLSGFEGLNREIKTITSIESPKSAEMLKGGEFVLSSGVLFEGDDIDLLYSFVEQLIRQESIALGIKTRFVHEIPGAVIELACISGFTLLILPDDCVWSDFFSIFYKMSDYNDERIIDSSESSIKELSHLNNYGPQLINQKFVEIIRFGAVITDADFNTLAKNDKPGVESIIDCLSNDYIKSAENRYADGIDPIGSFRSFVYKGYRITDIVLIRNAHLLLCHSQRNLSINEIELLQMNYNNLLNTGKAEKYVNGGVENIVGQILEELVNNSQIVDLNGIVSAPEFREAKCVVFYYVGTDIASFIEELSEQLKKQSAFKRIRFFYKKTNTKDEYIVLYLRKVVAGDDAPDNFFVNTLLNIKLQGTDFRAYFGSPAMFAGDIVTSHRQAIICKRYGKTIWEPNRVLFYRDIECLALLESLEINLSEIVDLDRKISSFDAIKTLEAILENKSVKQAANALFIHENTMRYRINKIQKVLNMDLNSSVAGLNLLIKIKLYKLQRLE